MATALTVAPNSFAASSTLSTANQLVTTSGGTTGSALTIKCGASTGWGELQGQSDANSWEALGAMGTPTGLGWFLDASTLDGKVILAGSWSAIWKMKASATGPVGDISVNAYVYNSGVYTFIGSLVKTGYTFTTTATDIGLTAASFPAAYFPTGSHLYIDCWLNITSNTSGSTRTISVAQGTSSGTADFTTEKIDTPGYATQSVRDISSRFRQMSASVLKDAKTRFRQRSADTLKDTITRFRLQVSGTQSIRDALTRFRQRSANVLKDTITRFRQQSASQLRDVSIRLRIAWYKDTSTRFRQRSANVLRDISTRLRIAWYKDASTRFRQRSANVLRDIKTRFPYSINDTPYVFTYFQDSPDPSTSPTITQASSQFWTDLGTLNTLLGGGLWVRYQYDWQKYEINPASVVAEPPANTPNYYDGVDAAHSAVKTMDAFIQGCNAIGVNVLLTVQNAPNNYLIFDDSGTNVGITNGKLGGPQAYTRFASYLATRYNGGANGHIEAMQIGNEEFDTVFGRTGAALPPTVNAAIPAVRAINSSLIVGMNCVRKTPTNPQTHITNWCNTVISGITVAANFPDFFDFHFYKSGTFNPDPTTQDSNCVSVDTELGLIDTALATYAPTGHTNTPIWCLETGWTIDDIVGNQTTLYTTLSGTIAESQTTPFTFTAASGTGFPTGAFYIIMKNEWMHCSSRSGTTFTVDQRNLESDGAGNTNLTHASGETIQYGDIITDASRAPYYTAMYEALRTHNPNPLGKVGIWTLDYKSPTISNSSVSSTWGTGVGSSWNAITSYMTSYPKWTSQALRIKDVSTRFLLRSANVLNDISTRYRQMSAALSKDTRTRLRQMSAFQLKDVSARLRQMSAASRKDATTRFRLAWYKDAASRLRLMSALQYRDIAARLRLVLGINLKNINARYRQMSAAQLKDAFTRFILTGANQRMKDLSARLRLMSASQFRDTSTRLRQMSASQFRDVSTRLRAMSAALSKDTRTRLRLMSAASLRDAAARLRLMSALQYKDISVRLLLATANQRIQDLAARLRLMSAARLKDTATRFSQVAGINLKNVTARLRLMSASQLRDAPTRMRLMQTNLKDTRTRLRQMSALQTKDASTRLRQMSANQLRDAATRLRLLQVVTKDTSSRVRVMSALRVNDIVTRLRLMSAVQFRDAFTRLRMRSANQLKDIVGRLALLSQPQRKDMTVRVRLMSPAQTRDVTTRLRQRSANQLRDVTLRLIVALAQQRTNNVAARFRVRSTNQGRDMSMRLCLYERVPNADVRLRQGEAHMQTRRGTASARSRSGSATVELPS